ncbi:MAG: PAS-domain containing protein, partial [Rubrivivax sp.]|nr:PAS-domain containing protein [Rubrivivax sp.]
PAAGGLPWALTAGLTSTALTLTALGWLWQRWRRAEQDLIAAATAQAQLAHQQLADVLDALPAGFELFDKDDRLVRSNAVLREMYPNIVQLLDQQPTFEAMVRHNHAAGGLPGLGESFEDWLAERLHTLRTPGSPILHQAAGGRWVRAHHRRLPDGGLIGVRVDVTEEVRQKEAAELAANRLSDAIEAISDGFAYYDADDRLVLCNERYRAVYGDLATMVVPGVTFEALVRRGLALGLFPQAAGHEQEWVAERVQQHRNPGPPFLQELPGNRWLNIDERRTRDGGVAGVRTDVTAMVRREQELQRLNDRLDAANTRLAQLSETDALTAIANRRQFDRRLAEEAARASRHGLPLALL